MRFNFATPRRTIQGIQVRSVVILLGMLSGGVPVLAQFDGDPFDPYRAAYRSSSLPVYSTIGPISSPIRVPQPPGLGSVPGYQGFSPINPALGFSSGFSPFGGRTSSFLGSVDPSADAYRYYDERFGRIYQPNMEADRVYREQMAQVEDLYFQMLSEQDPQRRQELQRRYQQASQRAQLLLARRPPSGRRAPTSTPTVPAAPGEPEAAAPPVARAELDPDPFANLPPISPVPPSPPPDQ